MNKDEVTPIWKDDREIHNIWEVGVSSSDEGQAWVVGVGGVSKIVPYIDDGIKDGDITWFAVYKGEEIVARVPAYGFGVEYKHGKE